MDAGFTLTSDSIGVLISTVNEVSRLKQRMQQVERKFLPGLPDEIGVPRSEEDGIYTVDIYIKNPTTGEYVRMAQNQTAELLPEEIPP